MIFKMKEGYLINVISSDEIVSLGFMNNNNLLPLIVLTSRLNKFATVIDKNKVTPISPTRVTLNQFIYYERIRKREDEYTEKYAVEERLVFNTTTNRWVKEVFKK